MGHCVASLKEHFCVPISVVRQNSTSHLIFSELADPFSSERVKLLKLIRAKSVVNFSRLRKQLYNNFPTSLIPVIEISAI